MLLMQEATHGGGLPPGGALADPPPPAARVRGERAGVRDRRAPRAPRAPPGGRPALGRPRAPPLRAGGARPRRPGAPRRARRPPRRRARAPRSQAVDAHPPVAGGAGGAPGRLRGGGDQLARHARLHARGRRAPRVPGDAPVELDAGGRPPGGRGAPAGPALHADDAHHHGGGVPDPRLLHRLHEGGPRVPALHGVPEPLRVLHADPGAGRLLPGDVRGVGGGGALLLPADRLLVQGEGQRGRREEGVHRQPHRRLRLPDRDVPAVRQPGDAGLRRLRGRLRERLQCRGRRARLRRARWSRRSASSCSWARPGRARRCRSTSGCPTPWPAPPRCPR